MESSDNKGPGKKRKAPRSWWWRLLRGTAILSLLVLIVLSGTIFYAMGRLPFLAKWAVERALPGARVEMKTVDILWPDSLRVENFELFSRKDGAKLLGLKAGTVAFDFQSVWTREIREVVLEQPVVEVSPRIGEAFAPKEGTPTPQGASQPWVIRRLKCAYGELEMKGFGPEGLELRAKFSCDLKDFAPQSAESVLHEIVLWDIASLPKKGESTWLSVDLIRLGIDFSVLRKDKLISSVQVEGGTLVFGESLRKMFLGNGEAEPAKPGKEESPWVIGTLALQNVNVIIDDERPDITDIRFKLNTALTQVPLSKAASQVGAQAQKIEINDLDIRSPLDPFTKVATIRSLEVEFTLGGLIRREIESINVSSPTIYVGKDLFWYMEDAQKRLGTDTDPNAPPVPPEEKPPDWLVKRFGLEDGRLVLGSGGRARYGIPLTFTSSATDVSLANLASLKAELELVIPEQDYVFADYQLEFKSQQGELRFAYPPEKHENNLVGTLRLTTIRWRQYQAADAWLSVTFDQQGINGLFGGKVYGGYASGGFSFFFNPDNPWIGWIAGKKIDLKKLTDIIAPKNFQMTGPMNFRLQLDAQAKEIQRVVGELEATKPGKMKITKLDDFLQNLPGDWPVLKKDTTRIALETLRDFDYTQCKGSFWFVDFQGILNLALQGPNGSRNFDVVLHRDDTPEGLWKQPEPSKSTP